LLLGFAAVNTGNNLLFLIVSALLGFMSVSGVLGVLNIQGLGLRLEIPDEIYAGLGTLLTLQLVNSKRRLPSFLLRVELGGASARFTHLPAKGSDSAALVLNFPGRGRQSLAGATLSSPFPINFFVRSTRLPLRESLVVFPAPRHCLASSVPDQHGGRGAAPAAAKGYEGELLKIADYSGGEPLKLIHWRLSARHEGLKVKELSAEVNEPVMLDITSLPGGTLEEKLCCGAFLINRFNREARPVGLMMEGKLFPPALSRAHRLKLLTELALYGKD